MCNKETYLIVKKILVALDRSAGSKQVFARALSLARANQAHLTLLHVLSIEEENNPVMSPYFVHYKERYSHADPQMFPRANKIYDPKRRDFKEKGLELLRFYAKKAIIAGLQTEFTQITGLPGPTICDFARFCCADVIIIGKRGYSSWQDMFLGNVSHYVIQHAPCSIFLVQTPVSENSVAPNSLQTAAFT